MEHQQKVLKDKIKSGTPFSLFEEKLLTGWPAVVIKKGKIVIKDNQWVSDPPPCQVLNEIR
jgi:dihydroorotase-like cyclic amidohydrolase